MASEDHDKGKRGHTSGHTSGRGRGRGREWKMNSTSMYPTPPPPKKRVGER